MYSDTGTGATRNKLQQDKNITSEKHINFMYSLILTVMWSPRSLCSWTFASGTVSQFTWQTAAFQTYTVAYFTKLRVKTLLLLSLKIQGPQLRFFQKLNVRHLLRNPVRGTTPNINGQVVFHRKDRMTLWQLGLNKREGPLLTGILYCSLHLTSGWSEALF